ncbi:MAG TPA: hypothetical protein VL418_01700 [Devosiaceae bacterium]|nr:hypothetical protein [Devosiaceae bacterium]
MRKFANLASLAVVAIGFTAIAGGSAFAAPHNRSDDPAYDAQYTQQNDNYTTEQSFGTDRQWATDSLLDSHPNQAHSSTHQSSGNS